MLVHEEIVLQRSALGRFWMVVDSIMADVATAFLFVQLREHSMHHETSRVLLNTRCVRACAIVAGPVCKLTMHP